MHNIEANFVKINNDKKGKIELTEASIPTYKGPFLDTHPFIFLEQASMPPLFRSNPPVEGQVRHGYFFDLGIG